MAWEETSTFREVQTGTAKKQWAKPSVQTIDLHAAEVFTTSRSSDGQRPHRAR